MTGITKSHRFFAAPAAIHRFPQGKLWQAADLAGSTRYRGCAQLATAGALRCGAGLLPSLPPNGSSRQLPAIFPKRCCSLFRRTRTAASPHRGFPLLQKTAAGQTAIAAGCGLTCADGPAALIRALIALPVPLVLDADGLNLVASDPGALRWRAAPTLLTTAPR